MWKYGKLVPYVPAEVEKTNMYICNEIENMRCFPYFDDESEYLCQKYGLSEGRWHMCISGENTLKVLERARYDYQVNKDKTLRNICRASKLDCFGTTGITKFVCSIAGMVSNEVIEKSLLLTSSNPSRLTGSVAAATVLEGKSDAEKIEYSYAEYIQNISNQKNSESYEEDKAYWLNKIDSLSSYPQIPMKMKLADCRDYNIVRKSAIIDSVLWGNFKETARRHKVSPSALLCTLYGRTMAKWGNQSEVLLNLTVFQRQQKNTGKIIGDFTKLLPLNLVFAKEDIWKSAEMVQEQIMKDLDHLSFDGTEIMRELAKRRGVFGKALLPVVFTCVLFDCPENYFERLGSIKYAVSQTPQVFLDNQITEMGGRLHISWDVVDELFEACIIDEIFLEFVEDIKRISENNKANSTNDFVTKVWGNILTKEIITKSVVPDLLKSIDLKQIKILDYAQELCPPDVKGQVYVSESEIMNDRNKTYYKILEHPLYGRMADTGIIGVLTHDGYMEFVVPNCETSVETPDKKEDTHEEEIEKPIVKEIMKIWKEVFEIEDISIQDDFYTLGGDSIILMRLVDEMCKTLGCDVTVDDILQSENISDLANRV